MARLIFLDRESDPWTIDGEVKNKFRWCWLEEKDSNGDFLSDYIRKIPEPGMGYCMYCKRRLNYATKGKSIITRHAQSQHHVRRRNEIKSGESLPVASNSQAIKEEEPTTSSASSSSHPYGVAPNVEKATLSPETSNTTQPPRRHCPPSMKDRTTHLEAITCSFIAEHSLPLSMAPHLIGYAQLLAQDHDALQSLSMDRQTATDKLKFGLKKVQLKKLVRKLKTLPFSLNIDLDEFSTKHGKKHVLNILVCFFDEEACKSVTHLYSAVELYIVNADTVFQAISYRLVKDKIPLINLISVLSDSQSYMRGIHNAFFLKLKEIAPHLLDIEGDVRHHVHNITKLFTTSVDIDNLVFFLLDDIHSDFENCTYLKQQFSSICSLLKIRDLLPKQRIGHSFNILECCERFLFLKDALTVLYFSFLSASDENLFQNNISEIFQERNVLYDSRKQIYKIWQRLKSEDMTEQGKARKRKVCRKLFDFQSKTNALVDIFISVLPLFKDFILNFENKTPQLHLLHDGRVRIFKKFLEFYVKPEFIREAGKDLAGLDMDDESTFLPYKQIYKGEKNAFSRLPSSDRDAFKTLLLDAYKKTGRYMQQKLSLNNPLLRIFSSLDPKVFGQAATGIHLRKLPSFLTSVHAPNFHDEIMIMQSDMEISPSDCQLHVWWGKIFRMKRYLSVNTIISACLSIFTGPRVQQSSSMMNAIISENAPSLWISTYEAYMFNKYHLLALESSTLQAYKSPVDSSCTCVYYFQTAASRSKKRKTNQTEPQEEEEGPPSKKVAAH